MIADDDDSKDDCTVTHLPVIDIPISRPTYSDQKWNRKETQSKECYISAIAATC